MTEYRTRRNIHVSLSSGEAQGQRRRRPMPIKFYSHHAIFDHRTDSVRVPAVVDNKLVVCAVAHEAIKKVLRSGDGPAAYLLDTYRRFQRAFHTLVIYKYRAKKTQPDGTVFIDAEDFAALDSPSEYKKSPTLN
jgi:hypothetical protein